MAFLTGAVAQLCETRAQPCHSLLRLGLSVSHGVPQLVRVSRHVVVLGEVDKVADVIDLELQRIKRRPKYTEELLGETPLGGEMRLSHNFDDDDPEPPSAA